MRELNLNLSPVVSYRYIAEIEFEMHAVPKAPKGTIIKKKLSGRREKTPPPLLNPRCSFCQALTPIVIL